MLTVYFENRPEIEYILIASCSVEARGARCYSIDGSGKSIVTRKRAKRSKIQFIDLSMYSLLYLSAHANQFMYSWWRNVLQPPPRPMSLDRSVIRPRGGTAFGGRSGTGFVGDPHFVIPVKPEFKICFNFDGKTGEVTFINE